MSKMNLDPGAKFMLASLQQQSKPVTADVEAKISQACEAKGDAALTMKELSKLLVQAMPDAKQSIIAAEKSCVASGYHSDGTNANFLTQFVAAHSIEKERAVAVRPRAAGNQNRRWTRDPLEAKFMIDNDAKSMFLFNGRDVSENGQPLLMKAVLRVSDPSDADKTAKEVQAFKDSMGGFAEFRTHWGEGAKDADIRVIGPDDAYVEIKDIQEREFQFGDPLLQVSRNGKGEELSRGVAINPDNTLITKYYASNADGSPNLRSPARRDWNSGPRAETATGANLDTALPQAYDQRIELSMKAKESFPAGGWLNTRADQVDVGLTVQPGLIFEPNKNATVTFMGTKLATGVPKDDAFFMGSPSAAGAVKTEGSNLSLKQLLTQSVQRSVVSGAGGSNQDAATVAEPAHKMIFKNPGAINIGGRAFAPLADVNLKKADLGESTGVQATLTPINDPEHDGTTVSLVLDKAFVAAEEGHSVEGWSVVVGFTDHDGSWKQCDAAAIDDGDRSQRLGFTLKMENAPELMKKGRSLEIRLFNENGVPAQRVQVPFQAMPWDTSVVPKPDGGNTQQQSFSPASICGSAVKSESKLEAGGKISHTEDGHMYFVDKGTSSPIDALQAKRLQAL